MSFVKFTIQNLTSSDVVLTEVGDKLVRARETIEFTLRRESLTDLMRNEISDLVLRNVIDAGVRIAPSNSDLVSRIRGARDESSTSFYDRTVINVLAAQSVQAAIDELALNGGLGGVIGLPTSGDYSDGLFPFTPMTKISDAVQSLNEAVGSLAPPPAPNFDNIGSSQVGPAGRLSFGPSNPIAGYNNHPTLNVNGLFSNTGDNLGVFDAATAMTGLLASNAPAHPYAYPANAFSDADVGYLLLQVNGVDVHIVNLETFGSGLTTNVNGSGFNLSAATPVEFDDGSPLEEFKYRTGTWVVDPADLDDGYNEIRVIQEVAVADVRTSQTLAIIIDGALDGTVFVMEQLHSLAMVGSDRLSGVTYHNDGTALYDVVVQNGYRNTYSPTLDAISHPGSDKSSLSDQAIPSITTDESDLIVIDDKSVAIETSQRIIDEGISVNTRLDRTVQPDVSSSGVSAFKLLLDPFINSGNATNSVEVFDDEGYRLRSDVDILDTGYGSGPSSSPADWDSMESLIGVTPGYIDGLLLHDGSLRYPTNAPFSGDFSQVVDGPVGNVDYSSASGNRTYLRYFPAPVPSSNFNLDIQATNTNFVPVSTGPSGNDLTLEILAPNSTQNGVGTVEFKDAIVPYTDDDSIGAFAATFGNNIPTDIGLTIGTKTTATAGGVLVVRITASAAWAGQINQLSLTFL